MPAETGGHLLAPKWELSCGCAEPQELSAAHIITEPKVCPKFCALPSQAVSEMGTNRELGCCSLGMCQPIQAAQPQISCLAGLDPRLK